MIVIEKYAKNGPKQAYWALQTGRAVRLTRDHYLRRCARRLQGGASSGCLARLRHKGAPRTPHSILSSDRSYLSHIWSYFKSAQASSRRSKAPRR
ncbi:hypothetical protein E3N88_18979 [Mikania micrantha]|uniref:Uncharacterized protein n=1 Tax=Mikania micrantha TaxID=192012 RepID=A0A5N6NNU4_9ASTR|nr:hypothetical protein E3N88_18979 [Mikania micrantha]